MKINNKNNKPGIASIPTVLVLLALILAVGAMIAAISFSDNVSVNDANNSGRALNYAQVGAQDALEKITRNKDYATSSSFINIVSGGCSVPYRGCASTSVIIGTSTNIISQGRVGDSIRKIQVNVILDSNGLITGYTWTEL